MHTRPKIIAAVMVFVLTGCPNMSGTQLGASQSIILFNSVADFFINALFFRIGGGKITTNDTDAGAEVVASYAWSQKTEKQKKQIQAVTADTSIQVSKTYDNRLKLDIPSDITFDVGAQIKPNMWPILDSFSDSLMQNPDTYIIIIGHRDNSGNDVLNNALSFERAASIRDYLVRQGVLTQRISINGPGSHESFAANNTKSNRETNARIEIYVFEL